MTAPHRRPARLLVTAASLAAAAWMAPAASASAAVVSVDQACYVNAATIAQVTVSGQGFTPGDEVNVSGADHFSAVGIADSSGAFTATASAPTLPAGPRSQKFVLTATDLTTAGVMAQTTIEVANLAVAISRRSVANVAKDKVTFSFSGFTPGKHIYGFYLHGHKVVASGRFGKASGPCGVLQQRALQYPGGRPHYSAYNLAFESTNRYSKRSFPQVNGLLDIVHF
jgi:hypothetical protein